MNAHAEMEAVITRLHDLLEEKKDYKMTLDGDLSSLKNINQQLVSQFNSLLDERNALLGQNKNLQLKLRKYEQMQVVAKQQLEELEQEVQEFTQVGDFQAINAKWHVLEDEVQQLQSLARYVLVVLCKIGCLNSETGQKRMKTWQPLNGPRSSLRTPNVMPAVFVLMSVDTVQTPTLIVLLNVSNTHTNVLSSVWWPFLLISLGNLLFNQLNFDPNF